MSINFGGPTAAYSGRASRVERDTHHATKQSTPKAVSVSPQSGGGSESGAKVDVAIRQSLNITSPVESDLAVPAKVEDENSTLFTSLEEGKVLVPRVSHTTGRTGRTGRAAASSYSDAPPVSELPKNLDNLTIGEQLGRGMFGAVYRATNSQGETCIVKSTSKFSKTAIKRLAGTNGCLKPQIGQASIDGFSEEVVFLPEIKGKGLDAHLPKLKEYFNDPDVANADKRNLFLFLTHASLYQINQMHAVGLTHTDMKPDNILLQRDMLPVVIDVDFAMTSEEWRTDMDHFGTPEYGSPEKIKVIESASDPLAQKPDVFALGAIFLELFSDRLLSSETNGIPDIDKTDRISTLYFAETEGTLSGPGGEFDKRVNEALDRSFLGDTSNADLRAVMRSMLKLDPEIRPSSREALERISPEFERMMRQTNGLAALRRSVSVRINQE